MSEENAYRAIEANQDLNQTSRFWSGEKEGVGLEG